MCERRILQFHPSEGAESGAGERIRAWHEEVVEDEGARSEEYEPESEPRADEEEVLKDGT